MTRYYYFLVALLMSDYQIERRQLTRSIDVALYKRNKNKATSLRIRSRTASTGCQGIFSSIHYQMIVCYRKTTQNCPILKLLSLSLHEKTRSILALLNPCPLFSSRISRHVLMPRFICGISYPECRQKSNNYIWR